jgi:hypothetical protein|tara:strand:- start:1078 stop:1266 length:189 start_codon:yes stop_codon:yes gene_type:complete
MEDFDLAETIKKNIEDRRELIKNTLMNGMLKDIEHYKSLQGELNSLLYVEQVIKDYYKRNSQ